MKLNRLKQIIKEEILKEIKVERSPDIIKPPFFTLENHGHYVFNAGADTITNPWFSELRKDNRIHDWYEYDANTLLEPNKDLNYYLDAMPSIPRKVYRTMFATLDAYKIPFEWWFEPKFVDDEGDEYSPMLRTTLDLRKIPSEYIDLRNLNEIKVDKTRLIVNPFISGDKDPIIQDELESLKSIYDATVSEIERQRLDYPLQASIEYTKDFPWMIENTDDAHGRVVMVFSKGSEKLGVLTFSNSMWGYDFFDPGYSTLFRANTAKGMQILWDNGNYDDYVDSSAAPEGILAWITNI
jgi:hypothetical protein